ncbi:MAG: ADP/ATP-dependent (S)-NAD(P)H-hydrate dehydratase [Acidimicrobiales bacterium]|nr:ADP/ATP-dependent (S)-NAD(P)H-hydrate dehydratase [Acidimicrobiales bacterium]
MSPLTELLTRHPLPDPEGGKDDRGTLVLIGGPPECPGGVLLAAQGALRTGSGRVQLVVHPAVATAVAVAVPEALVLPWDQAGALPDATARSVSRAQAVVIGCGHSADLTGAVGQVAQLLGSTPLVLDAGALEGSALDAAERFGEAPHLVLAPNVNEARSLLADEGTGDDAADQVGVAVRLAERTGGPVAVRGASTVVVDGDGRWRLDGAPPGLGTPGSGDVLMGVLGGLLARGLPAAGALGWAVALHARAGAELAAQTPIGFLARDIAVRLPAALAGLRSEVA